MTVGRPIKENFLDSNGSKDSDELTNFDEDDLGSPKRRSLHDLTSWSYTYKRAIGKGLDYYPTGLLRGDFSSCKYSLVNTVSGCCWGWGTFSVTYYIKEIVSGLIVGFAQVPESVAFSFMAHVYPSCAVHSAWMLGIICAVFGGRPGMINGATGTSASIVGSFVTKKCDSGICVYEGIETVFLSIIFASILMLLFAILRLSTFVQMIPSSAFIGFCNGLAIVIARSQFHVFKDPVSEIWYSGRVAGCMAANCIIAMGVVEFWPLIPKVGHFVPSTLVAMLVSVFIEFVLFRIGFKVSTPTVGTVAAFKSKDATPMLFFLDDRYSVSNISWTSKLLTQSIVLALCGILETLMTVAIMNDAYRNIGNSDQQVFASAIGNSVSGMFGGMGGCSMIGLSVLNFRSGGKGRESGIVAALCVLIFLVGGYKVLNFLPMAALAGVMFTVCIHTFKWFSLLMILTSCLPAWIRKKKEFLNRKICRFDALIIVLVTLLTVFWNLAYAVLAGISVASVAYSWSCMKRMMIKEFINNKTNTKYYDIHGPLFFGTRMKFEKVFDYDKDPENVIVTLEGSHRLFDYSSMDAMNRVRERYVRAGKYVSFKGLTVNCIKMVRKANKVLHHIDETCLDVELYPVPEVYN